MGRQDHLDSVQIRLVRISPIEPYPCMMAHTTNHGSVPTYIKMPRSDMIGAFAGKERRNPAARLGKRREKRAETYSVRLVCYS